jgi:hypothetical protein
MSRACLTSALLVRFPCSFDLLVKDQHREPISFIRDISRRDLCLVIFQAQASKYMENRLNILIFNLHSTFWYVDGVFFSIYCLFNYKSYSFSRFSLEQSDLTFIYLDYFEG